MGEQVDTWTHTRIFCSEKEDARPLYEDGKERLQDIRRLVRNNEVGLRIVVAAFAFYFGYQFFKGILEYPLDYLSESGWVGMSGIITILIILITAQPVRGIIWMCILNRKIKSGDYSLVMNTAGYMRRKDLLICLTIVSMSALSMLLATSVVEKVLAAAAIILSLMALASPEKWKGTLRISAVAVLLVLTLCTWYSVDTMNADIPENAVSYADLTGKQIEREDDLSSYRSTESCVLKRVSLYEHGKNDETLYYYIVDVKNEKQYEWFFNKALMEDTYLHAWREDVSDESLWEETSDAAWGADRVYVMPGYDNEWILGKGNRIIRLELDFEPSDSKKAEIVKMLEEAIDEA